MRREHAGDWQQVTRCTECGWIGGKAVKWFDVSFVDACPGCGERNTSIGLSGWGTTCGRWTSVRSDGRGFPPDIAARRLAKRCNDDGCPSTPAYRAGIR